ncbi:MAG TPA: FAD-dependent oxidoreductase [Chitinophagales bacterium]|nr:FAD-dependent oxidoreductase [Chitinophagales bacterium]HNL83999.1 FAD-dependent oxidoreductase [Chitinophagales bacterium]
MKRRHFLKKTLTNLPVLIAAPTLIAASCNKEVLNPNDLTIVVVGAGISGLAAAKKLKNKGFKVIVMEAQDKVGGRLRTNRTLGVAFDEGASWIHGIAGNPIIALAQEAGMSSIFADDTSIKSYDMGGFTRSASTYTSAEDEFYTIIESMMSYGSTDKSFETVFNARYPDKINDRLWKFLLSAYMTFDTGDLDKLSSLLYFEGEEYTGGERLVSNGYETIATYLANGLDIMLNQRVSSIDYSEKKIKVTHNALVTDADYVIVSVPLGVLKNNSISFTPALPSAKQTAIQKLGMNCVNKFLLTWDSAFWDDVHYISYTPEIKDKFNYFVNVKKINSSVNALMTFAYANYARQTETMTDAQVINEIMLHLKDMYGNSIPNPTHFLRTKWNSNINSFGSYSYTAVGSEMRHFEDIAEEVNNKLFFCGEHTEVDYFSTVHGAYLSGIREADKIIDLL